MGFKQLITKVHQAEMALEAQERRVSADWRQLKASWLAAWTPGRVVLAGVVSGFVIGRAQPFKAAAKSGQIMQLVTMLSGLFAGGTAKVAADEAEHAAQTAENVADVVAPEAAVAHPEARGGPMGGTRPATPAADTRVAGGAPPEAARVEAAPIEAVSIETGVIEGVPGERVPGEHTPVERARVDPDPTERTRVERASNERPPVDPDRSEP